MTRDPVLDFYGELADDYHLIHDDWEKSLRRQADELDAIIRARIGAGTHSLLDCSCGIGTQALGLAALGYRVRATDISRELVTRAEHEAAKRGLGIGFGVADMRALEAEVKGVFDVVLSCDNALAHMLTDSDLERAAAGMAAKAAPGGLVLASIRDYDALACERPRFAPLNIHDAPNGQRLMVQLWDWRADGPIYDLTMFILRRDGGEWRMSHHSSTLRAVRRDEVSAALARAGLAEVAWRLPPASGYYQPVVTARKPA